MTILYNFHEIKALGLFEALDAEVVDDEHIGLGQAAHQFAVSAIEASELELFEELLCIEVQRPEAQVAGVVPKS